MKCHVDVIATTISGSIQDWGKVKLIVPLFKHKGINDVQLYSVDSYIDARRKASELVNNGSEIIISAGGSGTFNSIIEGCFDAQKSLNALKIGFLRKGSADLIGKTLGMPDTIEDAIDILVKAIQGNRIVPCDVIMASSGEDNHATRRFVGYGGAEIFGEIPYFTENRFIKYYKGILGQIFGDLGPFFVGANCAIIARLFRSSILKKQRWSIVVDGNVVTEGRYQAIIIVNGDLGPNLPFARSEPLGSGYFHVFTIRNLGTLRLASQFKKAFDASILDDPERWGFESFRVSQRLKITPDVDRIFPVNVDGSTMSCSKNAQFKIIDQINLLSGK